MQNAKVLTNLFITKDSFHATLLLSNEQTLDSFYWEGMVCFFVFEDEATCQKIIKNHLEGKLKISSRALEEAQRTIRNILRYR